MSKSVRAFYTLGIVVWLLFGFVPTALSEEVSFSIKGNGESSTNSITVQETSSVTVVQGNSAEVSTNVDINANTGGNTINGNSGSANLTTGNVTTDVTVTNILNSNLASATCCSNPEIGPTPTTKPNGHQPTPTPTSNPGGNGNGGNGDGGNGHGGNGSGSSSSDNGSSSSGGIGGADIGQVLGLAYTGSAADGILRAVGTLCLALGLLLGRKYHAAV